MTRIRLGRILGYLRSTPARPASAQPVGSTASQSVQLVVAIGVPFAKSCGAVFLIDVPSKRTRLFRFCHSQPLN